MTDYIKREDALDSLRDGMCGTGYQGMAMDCLNEIYVPSADVAPVVRCKDCVYYQDNNDGYPHDGCRWRSDETPDAEDFCSMAQRKDDEID